MTSTIKVNNIQNQCGANIINESSNTITLGASGDTVALASGASQTGFGRTGTVDWQTGSIKTATFTAANGEGYFANTSGSAFTMNLPAGTAGNIVSVVDYTNTFQTNNLTITPNGSQKIGGVAASIALETEGQSVTFVYVDDIEGWKNVQDSTSNVIGNEFIVATGGTVTCSGNCKIHTFTGPGTFTVSQVHPCAANNLVSYAIVGGGGGAGGGDNAGGGGAGGFRETKSPVTPYTASPLCGYSTPGNRVTVTATAFPVVVGGGGAGAVVGSPDAAGRRGTNGVNSSFGGITGAGGGAGGAAYSSSPDGATGANGGSGGGGGHCGSPIVGGTGNTPPVTPAQGKNGGSGAGGGSPPAYGGGGGGGATAVGQNGSPSKAGDGGAGAPTSINGSPTTFAGGGGGGAEGGGCSSGGSGGGGPGRGCNPTSGTPGTANTGGGGGSAGSTSPTITVGNGGSGIVIIRYKYQ
jgi:hypothetical protein